VAQRLLNALANGTLRAVTTLNLDTLKSAGDKGVEVLKGGGEPFAEGAGKAAEGLKKLFD
jgi:hypothetical protein